MIPHRITLSGFLSYKGEQDVRFDGAPLWLLAGTNGSGKSSVFDAVTYALFGAHRGGSQNAGELINKDSQGFTVSFDFGLGGQSYRVRRTLKKSARGNTTATQQVFRHAGSGIGTEDGWEAVPDTTKKTDFDAWVAGNVGLNYETFTSSVLLLQGKAEKLLDSTAAGRASVLAGIVDLARYQKLHEKASKRRLGFAAQLEALSHQTAGIPDVTDFDIVMADGEIETAVEGRTAADAAVETARRGVDDARRWADAATRAAAAKEKLRQAERVLADAVKIEQQFHRLRDLTEALPAVHQIVTTRARLKQADARIEQFEKDRRETQDRQAQLSHDLDTAKKSRDRQRQQLAADEEKRDRGTARLRELSGVLQSLKLADDQEAEWKRLSAELAKSPGDAAAAVQTAQDEFDTLAELDRVLPVLERVHAERAELSLSNRRHETATKNIERLFTSGKELRVSADAAAADFAACTATRAKADEAAAVTTSLSLQARSLLDEFDKLAGEPQCRACGQPLTKAHFAAERKKREADARTADQKAAAAVAARLAAVEAETTARTAKAGFDDKLVKLREEYKAEQAEAKHAAADAERQVRLLKTLYAELPHDFRVQISPAPPADWAATSYPARDELPRLKTRAAGLAAAKQSLRRAADALTADRELRAKAETAKQTLARVRSGLPTGDADKLRSEHRTLQADEATLLNQIKAAKLAVRAADDQADRFTRDAHTATQQLAVLVGNTQTEEANRRNGRENIETATRRLSPEWRPVAENAGLVEYNAWSDEKADFESADISTKYRQLEHARGGLDSLRADAAGLETAAAAFPPESRIAPAEAAAAVDAARAGFDAADRRLADARRRKGVLDGHREQRGKLGDRYKQVDAEHNRYKILGELLGRDRLQRHLVRQAERQIVDYANGVLDRLSGGQLCLQLVTTDDSGAAEKALELEAYNRVTGGSPINVMFLSGSQKFRVAVSLALGIGQYAGRQHRAVESVIIDEGFGCLDRQGRQVMIQELQNLRGHLQCILLVSHQEEFADAFPDGYRFELDNGATKVTRFRR